MTDKINIPIPAAAANCGPFKVLDSEATNENFCVYPTPETKNIGMLSVPLGSTPAQIAIRCHEYGHLWLISSGFHSANITHLARRKIIDDYWFQTALDVIVNNRLISLGCREISDLPFTVPSKAELRLDPAFAALILLKSNCLKSERLIRARVAKVLPKEDIVFLQMVNKKLADQGQHDKLPLKEFFALIKNLQERFGVPLNLLFNNWGNLYLESSFIDFYEEGEETNLDNIVNNNDFVDFMKKNSDFLTTGQIEGKKIKQIAKKLKIKIDRWNRWGNMEIINLPLTRIHSTRKNARKFFPGFVGAFRYPHRALLPACDGAAFAYRQKAKGGTILLDCSGSMHLRMVDIDRLLAFAPMLTVAGYVGINEFDYKFDYKNGLLVVFIKNGMLASQDSIAKWYEKKDGGNIIDGPALRWLIKQPKPHIWISDGEVTGIGDRKAKNLDLEVAILQKLRNIKRFNTIGDCLKYFRPKN